LLQHFGGEFAGEVFFKTLENARQFSGFFISALEVFQNRQPFVTPVGDGGQQPALPVGRFGGGEFLICSASQPAAADGFANNYAGAKSAREFFHRGPPPWI